MSGPVDTSEMTPAEVAAQVASAQAAGAEAMQAQIAGWINEVRDYCISQRDAAESKAAEDLFDALARDRKGILDGIALMPLPAPDALARVKAEAEARGMELAACWHDEQAKAAGEWRYWGGPSDGAMQARERHHIDSAGAIRATAKERRRHPRHREGAPGMSDDAIKAALAAAVEAARVSLGSDGGCLQIACENCTAPPCACAANAAAAAVAAFLRALPCEFKASVQFDSGNIDDMLFYQHFELLGMAVERAAREGSDDR